MRVTSAASRLRLATLSGVGFVADRTIGAGVADILVQAPLCWWRMDVVEPALLHLFELPTAACLFCQRAASGLTLLRWDHLPFTGSLRHRQLATPQRLPARHSLPYNTHRLPARRGAPGNTCHHPHSCLPGPASLHKLSFTILFRMNVGCDMYACMVQ